MAKLMDENLRAYLGQRLGVNSEVLRREGWGAVPSRTCGMLVRAAVEVAEETMLQQHVRR
jgi:small acid-soluble spore protein F (minor alpha/beta-type SASP)